jgi:hypothetical protein
MWLLPCTPPLCACPLQHWMWPYRSSEQFPDPAARCSMPTSMLISERVLQKISALQSRSLYSSTVSFALSENINKFELLESMFFLSLMIGFLFYNMQISMHTRLKRKIGYGASTSSVQYFWILWFTNQTSFTEVLNQRIDPQSYNLLMKMSLCVSGAVLVSCDLSQPSSPLRLLSPTALQPFLARLQNYSLKSQ